MVCIELTLLHCPLPNGNDTKIYIDTRHNTKLDEFIEMASSTQPVVMQFCDSDDDDDDDLVHVFAVYFIGM